MSNLGGDDYYDNNSIDYYWKDRLIDRIMPLAGLGLQTIGIMIISPILLVLLILAIPFILIGWIVEKIGNLI